MKIENLSGSVKVELTNIHRHLSEIKGIKYRYTFNVKFNGFMILKNEVKYANSADELVANAVETIAYNLSL